MSDTLEQRLLALVLAANYHPNKPRVLAKRLDLSAEERVDLRRLVKKLVKAGKLRYGKNHLIYPPTDLAAATEPGPQSTTERKAEKQGKPKPGIVGTFRRTGQGYGFVRPLTAAAAGNRDMDIYIAADDAADAVTGDVVRVKVSSERDRRRNASGKIVEIVERQTHQFVGTYFEAGGGAFVQVDGIPQLLAVGRRGDRRSPRPARRTGHRHAFDHPRVQSSRGFP
jgi:ribonuclease R